MYLDRDINVFVMYYVYGASRPSLLIESTDSMITDNKFKPLIPSDTQVEFYGMV